MIQHSHPDATAFVSRILSDPADPVIRSVFADWLLDQGGVANENWARYLRLRADAAIKFGTESELLREEADQLAPHLKARLNLAAAKFAPKFHHFLDLLPAGRYTILLDNFDFPRSLNDRLGGTNARAARSLILAERDGLFAVVTDMPMPGLARVLGQRIGGRVLLFATPTADLNAALDRTFPHVQAGSESTPSPEELNQRLARATVERLVAEAREERATQLEVVALPSGFEVRFVSGGRSKRKETLKTDAGERVVNELSAPDAYTRLLIRCRPRNTSFGPGAMVDL